MSIFQNTWSHVKEGAHYLENVAQKTGTKLHDFYVKEKPKLAELAKKEAEAVKQGAHKVKELYDKEAPKVKQFLQEESALIQDKVKHALDDEHQNYLHLRNKEHGAQVQVAHKQVMRTPVRQAPRPRPLPAEVPVRAHERATPSGQTTNVRQHTRCINYQNKIYCLNDELTSAKKQISSAPRVSTARKRAMSGDAGMPNVLRSRR